VTPVPDSGTASDELEALLATERLLLANPLVVGVNVTLNVVL
jgi:hypothetical protein